MSPNTSGPLGGLPILPPASQTELVTDPVCGMQVDPARSAGSFEFQGKTYYFCHLSCRSKFQSSPEKYLAHDKPTISMEEIAQDGEIIEYVCPMCPEVLETAPVPCPICGMALEPRVMSAGAGPSPELRSFTRKLLYCAPVAACLMLSHLLMSGPSHHEATGEIVKHTFTILGISIPLPVFSSAAIFSFFQFVGATFVMIVGGTPIFHRAWQSVVTRRLNMFTLLGGGAGIGYLVSFLILFSNGFLGLSKFQTLVAGGSYFESSAVIITLALLGQVLEMRARRATSNAMRKLLDLGAKTARVVRADGTEMEISADHVKVGEKIRIRSGEKIPVDGVITEGNAFLNESMLTGEPLPVAKSIGAEVSAGTLNGSTSFVFEARSVGRKTRLGQIVKAVEEAQRTRAPSQRLADGVSAYFVPAVLLLSVASFFFWAFLFPMFLNRIEPTEQSEAILKGLSHAISILVIACPCALGLATPMSIMVGMGRAAELGLLFRDAATLETLAQTSQVIFDKTGTLTEGKPRVTQLSTAPPFTEDNLLAVAASLEQGSDHPLAKAIESSAAQRKIPLQKVNDIRSAFGQGVEGTIEFVPVALGSPSFIAGKLSRPLPSSAGNSESSTVWVSRDGVWMGEILLEDTLRESALATVQSLKQRHIAVAILSGDAKVPVAKVARTLGIDEFKSELLPSAKLDFIRAKQQAGSYVLMVGDGINDGPALAAANAGLALAKGSDVAVASAGVTLLNPDLRGVGQAIDLSEAVRQNIRVNLLLAFGYNAVCLPLAAGAADFLPVLHWFSQPSVASLAMSISSVTVILNSLRLARTPIGR